MLSSVYTNSSQAYCYDLLGHAILSTRAHTRNRAGLGRVRVRVARALNLRTRMQFDLGGAWTCYILKIIFVFQS